MVTQWSNFEQMKTAIVIETSAKYTKSEIIKSLIYFEFK